MKDEIHLTRLIVVIPLLESEMVIDPGLVIAIDKAIDVVQLWSGILLNSLPCYSNKAWGNKAGGCCLLHKAFEDLIPRSVQLLQLQSLDLWPNSLGVMVVAARVQWSEFNWKTLMWACLKSERTEDRVRSRPRSSAVSFTIMNMRLYVFCCLL